MNVLCVVAHPDDEVLGCGGTLAKHAENGDRVFIRCFTTRASVKHGQLQAAARTLGATASEVMLTDGQDRFVARDQRLDTYPISTIADAVSRWQADVVYTHNPDDLNRDHRIVSEAVQVAFRACHSQATLFAFETISSTEYGCEPFAPNWFVELSPGQMLKKTQALYCYPSEVRPPPHPRNDAGIYDVARCRGAQAGVQYAEAFRLLRHHA